MSKGKSIFTRLLAVFILSAFTGGAFHLDEMLRLAGKDVAKVGLTEDPTTGHPDKHQGKNTVPLSRTVKPQLSHYSGFILESTASWSELETLMTLPSISKDKIAEDVFKPVWQPPPLAC